jgi:hypothetical protein
MSGNWRSLLLNEFLKEHREVEELEAKVQRLEKAIGAVGE